jgi:hypothetical protein
MRRSTAFVALLVALVAAVFAATGSGAAQDGTLGVKEGNGFVQIRAVGGVIGRIANGTVRLADVNPGDGGAPIVKCDEGIVDVSGDTFDPNDVVKLCTGTDIRFRLLGGAFRLLVTGKGINLSVVGQGKVTLEGKPTDPGQYSVNDSQNTPLPVTDKVSFDLDATATIPSS